MTTVNLDQAELMEFIGKEDNSIVAGLNKCYIPIH
jgi:hypothetical protein